MTVEKFGDPNDAGYMETYTVPFLEGFFIEGVFINGQLNVDRVKYVPETNKFTLTDIEIRPTDVAYIYYKVEPKPTDGAFDIINVSEYNLHSSGNSTIISFLNNDVKRLKLVKEVMGVLINGLFYGDQHMVYDATLKQITVNGIELDSKDSISLMTILKSF
jgi:hypothetical protein